MLNPAIAALLKREGTGISWADLTFNPWIGCTKVGPACDGCYAETWDARHLHGPESHWGVGAPRKRTSIQNWNKPQRWNRIAAEAGVALRVFCLSLGDWADKEVEPAWRVELGDIIASTSALRWMMLTKRIPLVGQHLPLMFPGGVPANFWLGITVVTQAEVDRDLRRAVEVKRQLGISRLFLSMEPLVEPITIPPELMTDVDLIIVGGESGAAPRSMPMEWPRDLMAQCRRWGVAFHFKQQSQADFPRSFEDFDSFPDDLRVREMIA